VKNNGDGSFTLVPLPLEAQISPMYGILAGDFEGEGEGKGKGRTDLIMAGNFDAVKPELGKMSAGYGVYLRGDGRGDFTPVLARDSGFLVPGQARDIQRVRTRKGSIYVVSRNNDRPLIFEKNSAPAGAGAELKTAAGRPGH
jgi:hypothetical protein